MEGRGAGRGSWTGTPEVPGSRRNCGAMRGAGDPGGGALLDEPGAASGDIGGDIGGGATVAGFQRVPYWPARGCGSDSIRSMS